MLALRAQGALRGEQLGSKKPCSTFCRNTMQSLGGIECFEGGVPRERVVSTEAVEKV